MKNFLKVITIILSLSVAFLIGISNTKALIKTTFGDFPDLPYQSDYYLIAHVPNGTLTPRLVVGASGCTYSKFFTDVPPYSMSVGFYNNSNFVTSGTNCTLKAYQLLNGSWSFVSNITAGNKLGIADGTTSQANIATSLDLVSRTNINNVVVSAGTNLVVNSFNVDFEQGEVIIKDTGGAIANLVTYYIEPTFDDFVPDNYIFSYIENTTGGGFRDSHQFYLTYIENGITYNGITYHYYYNLPLSYNTGLTFSINDLEYNLIQENQFTAYLSSLTDISGYTMYDFRNYEFANMSDINTGSFGLSYQLNSNITINAINYNTNTKIDFLNSSYLINSNTDNNGVTWYEFNFNNEPIYLEFINNFNDTTDFYTYIDTYNLYLYFDNTAFIHMSGSPNSIESQDNVVNQQSYKDSQGNIIYNNNPIVIDIDNSNEFFQNLQRYFKDFDTDTFGLTGIITSPLNLIQNLLSDTCNSLVVPIPYINSNLILPCMNTIYSQYFGGFYVIYQDITFGIVAYWVVVRILNMVKDFRNPDHDEIEVLDL